MPLGKGNEERGDSDVCAGRVAPALACRPQCRLRARGGSVTDRIKASLGPCLWPLPPIGAPQTRGEGGLRPGVSQGWLHPPRPGLSTHQRPPRSALAGPLPGRCSLFPAQQALRWGLSHQPWPAPVFPALCQYTTCHALLQAPTVPGGCGLRVCWPRVPHSQWLGLTPLVSGCCDSCFCHESGRELKRRGVFTGTREELPGDRRSLGGATDHPGAAVPLFELSPKAQ